MIAILAALVLAASTPPSDGAPSEDQATTLEQLKQLYDQSCAGREYGAYDDICDQLSHQVKAAQHELDRAARHKGRLPSPTGPEPAATSRSTATETAKPPGGH